MEYRAIVSDVVVEDNYIWGILEYGKVLFQYDIINHEIVYAKRIEYSGSSVRGRFFHSITKNANKIMMIPTKGCRVVIFDVSSKTTCFLDLFDNTYRHEEKVFELWRCYSVGSVFVVTGYMIPFVFVIDAFTLKISRVFDLKNQISSVDSLSNIYFMDGSIIDNKIYIPIGFQNTIVKYNYNSNECEVVNLQCKYDGLFGVGGEDDKKLYCVGLNDSTNIIFESKNNDSNNCKYIINDKISISSPFWKPIVGRNNIYILPNNYNRAFLIDKQSGKVDAWREFEVFSKKTTYSFHCTKYYKGNVFVYIAEENVWFVYSEKDNRFQSFSISLEKPYVINDYLGEVIYDGDFVDLNQFITIAFDNK